MKLSEKEWRVLEALWAAPEGLSLGGAVEALRPATGWSRNTVLLPDPHGGQGPGAH